MVLKGLLHQRQKKLFFLKQGKIAPIGAILTCFKKKKFFFVFDATII